MSVDAAFLDALTAVLKQLLQQLMKLLINSFLARLLSLFFTTNI